MIGHLCAVKSPIISLSAWDKNSLVMPPHFKHGSCYLAQWNYPSCKAGLSVRSNPSCCYEKWNPRSSGSKSLLSRLLHHRPVINQEPLYGEDRAWRDSTTGSRPTAAHKYPYLTAVGKYGAYAHILNALHQHISALSWRYTFQQTEYLVTSDFVDKQGGSPSHV